MSSISIVAHFQIKYNLYIAKCIREEHKKMIYPDNFPEHVDHKESVITFRQEIVHKFHIERAWIIYQSRKLISMVRTARDQFATCLPQYELWNARLDLVLYPGLHHENGIIVLDTIDGSPREVEVDICKIATCKYLTDIYEYLQQIHKYMRARAYNPRVDRETLKIVDLDDLIYDEIQRFYII